MKNAVQNVNISYMILQQVSMPRINWQCPYDVLSKAHGLDPVKIAVSTESHRLYQLVSNPIVVVIGWIVQENMMKFTRSQAASVVDVDITSTVVHVRHVQNSLP